MMFHSGPSWAGAMKGKDSETVEARKVRRSKAHPGFKAAQSRIAEKEGVSEDAAGAILASASRHASPAAKHANPRLKRV